MEARNFVAVLAPVSLEVRLFGRPRFSLDSTAIAFSGFPRLPLLFAYLLLHRGTHRRDDVAFTLWPDDTEESARANLRRHLHAAAAALPKGPHPWISATHGQLQWDARSNARVDVERFESASISPDTLEEAVKIYSGELLAGFEDEWILPIRSRLQELQLQNLRALATRYTAASDFSRAVSALRKILVIDPWREDAVRDLLFARTAMGDRAGAISEYRAFSARLEEEIGAQPAAETREVYEQIAKQSASQATNSNISAEVTRCIGRTSEMETLKRLLSQRRMVTLCGPPGIGKSRFATHAANALSGDFPGGTWIVQLADLHSEDSVVDTLLRAMRVVQTGARSALDALCEAAGPTPTLFVLDSCERALAVASALTCALGERCPHAYVLATSRVPLKVASEAILRLHPLAPQDAAELFLDRAALIDPQYSPNESDREAIAAACNRLDCIPLAVALAASRMNVLSPTQIADRLETPLETMHPLRGAFEWSFEMLPGPAKAMFARLGIFAGGCTLDAVENVFGEDGAADVLDTLADLVDNSFVLALREDSGMRYGMLDTLREFALEKLHVSGLEEQTRQRHLAYYASLASNASVADLAADIDNIREVLRSGDLSAAVDLYPFWRARSTFGEGRRWIEAYLKNDRNSQSAEHGKALNAAAVLSALENDFDAAERYASEAMALHEAIGDAHALSESAHALGLTAHERGDVSAALSFFEASLKSARKCDDKPRMARALDNIGLEQTLARNFDAAAQSLNASLQLFRELDDEQSIAWVLYHLAGLAYHRGNYSQAIVLHESSAQLRRKLRDDYGVATSLEGLAKTYIALGELQKARTTQCESLAIWQRLRAANAICIAFEMLGAIALREGDVEQAGLYYGAAQRKRDAIGSKMEPLERAAYEADVTEATKRDAGAWTRGWNRSAGLETDALAAGASAAPHGR